ncbi:MAG: DUF2304 domain-containing protein [Planctomycetes bacterium]|nr:DUF2304 domain-containing protein [Planctomycetota bacterium]
MDTNIFLVTIPFCIFLLLFSLELIRRRHLKEKYALLWLFMSLGLLVFSVFSKIITEVAPLLGLGNLTLVVLPAFFFLLILCMNFSLSLSKLSDYNKILTQEYALLAQRVEALEEQLGENAPPRLHTEN